MLGEEIEDPNRVEKAGKLRGLGLLPTKKQYFKKKEKNSCERNISKKFPECFQN